MAIEECPVELHLEAELGVEARRVAAELGWPKTYDAEYVALAQMLGCQLVTFDGALLEATEGLSFVVAAGELVEVAEVGKL